MKKLIDRLKAEFLRLIPATIFFFTAFQLLAFTHSLMLEQYGIQVSGFLNATIAALVVAKVVLITDFLPFVNRFPHKPLIYNVFWKTLIYLFAAFVVRYIEHLLPFFWQDRNLAMANQHLLETVSWPRFWAVQLWLFVYFLMYCTIHEMVRVLGVRKMRQLFFGPFPAVESNA